MQLIIKGVIHLSNPLKFTVAISDSDPLSRDLLKRYLQDFSQIDVVKAIGNHQELIDFIKVNPVVAIFLNVESSCINGITSATKIKSLYPDILIIFVSSIAKYAAKSYDLDALDYLVKPITKDRLSKVVTKIEQRIIMNYNIKHTYNPIVFKYNHVLYFLNPSDIIFIEKVLRKTVIHTSLGKYSTCETLKSIEKKLGKEFFRCHRSFIININKIEKITPIVDRIYEVNFYKSNETANMSKRKFDEFYKILML